MASGSNQLTALLIGGTGATGKEVLKELNKSELISKIVCMFDETKPNLLTFHLHIHSTHSII